MKKGFICGILLLCMLLPVGTACAETNVYGKTLTTVRVRESASVSSSILDNITSTACVYILETTKNGEYTFGKVHYRNYHGEVTTGWVCLRQGNEGYVEVISDEEAKSFFAVSGGELPDARVGTFKVAGDTSSASSPAGASSKNAAVAQLQTALKALGYYHAEITGNVGERTESAIRAFQKAKGLPVTGKADDATLAAAQDALGGAEAGQGAPSQEAAAPAQEEAAAKSEDVKTLQEQLKSLGYYYGEITGNVGTKTEAAIKSFQKKQGLSVTGQPDDATLKAAQEALGHTEAEQSASSQEDAASSQEKTTAKSEDVRALQEQLKSLGYYYGEITGNVGAKTEAAIRSFQKKQGLSVTGQPDEATLKAAKEAAGAGKTLGKSESSSGSASATAGATVEEIKALQQDLKSLGYYYGEITGNVGTKTQNAIKAFQKKQGLSATGQPDDATLAAAKKAVGGSMAGSSIKTMQEQLKELGYYTGSVTGHIGNKTLDAIKTFQREKGLKVTGTANEETLKAIASAVKAGKQTVSRGKVYNVEWFANKTRFYNRAGLKKGNQAKLTDLTTGKSLYIYVQSTGNHADVEPVSASDTKTLCEIYGVSSPEKISYRRRPMLLQVGSYQMVCSIYGVPHGDDTIASNEFEGQFCLHFRGSKTHGTGRVDSDHQNAIEKATQIMENKGYTIVTTAPSI